MRKHAMWEYREDAFNLGRYSEDGSKRHEIVHVPSELHIPLENIESSVFMQSNDESPKKVSRKLVRYKLVASVCHHGSTLQNGHYVSYVFQNDTQTWYYCDDDVITKSCLEMAQEGSKTSGYCYFYEKIIFAANH
ncbi:ubiquitin carboxyl-terminal hydrolase-like protein 2 [Dinothrombium tinctorium]|uniref:Ubiquitin carboxyl-terminal hydrolase-like protein 2 n=1 Tax=Dinothrombium tinctorium TaxID=1965070 RepID=A0A443QC30_9ACAR|nr:ubiquitin carboxyl-terminal hydrolase-like protein 2 [Dinothrombium tinctorium]